MKQSVKTLKQMRTPRVVGAARRIDCNFQDKLVGTMLINMRTSKAAVYS